MIKSLAKNIRNSIKENPKGNKTKENRKSKFDDEGPGTTVDAEDIPLCDRYLSQKINLYKVLTTYDTPNSAGRHSLVRDTDPNSIVYELYTTTSESEDEILSLNKKTHKSNKNNSSKAKNGNSDASNVCITLGDDERRNVRIVGNANSGISRSEDQQAPLEVVAYGTQTEASSDGSKADLPYKNPRPVVYRLEIPKGGTRLGNFARGSTSSLNEFDGQEENDDDDRKRNITTSIPKSSTYTNKSIQHELSQEMKRDWKTNTDQRNNRDTLGPLNDIQPSFFKPVKNKHTIGRSRGYIVNQTLHEQASENNPTHKMVLNSKTGKPVEKSNHDIKQSNRSKNQGDPKIDENFSAGTTNDRYSNSLKQSITSNSNSISYKQRRDHVIDDDSEIKTTNFEDDKGSDSDRLLDVYKQVADVRKRNVDTSDDNDGKYFVDPETKNKNKPFSEKRPKKSVVKKSFSKVSFRKKSSSLLSRKANKAQGRKQRSGYVVREVFYLPEDETYEESLGICPAGKFNNKTRASSDDTTEDKVLLNEREIKTHVMDKSSQETNKNLQDASSTIEYRNNYNTQKDKSEEKENVPCLYLVSKGDLYSENSKSYDDWPSAETITKIRRDDSFPASSLEENQEHNAKSQGSKEGRGNKFITVNYEITPNYDENSVTLLIDPESHKEIMEAVQKSNGESSVFKVSRRPKRESQQHSKSLGVGLLNVVSKSSSRKTSSLIETIPEEETDEDVIDDNIKLRKKKAKRRKNAFSLEDNKSDLFGSLETEGKEDQQAAKGNVKTLNTNVMAFPARTDNFSPWKKYRYDDKSRINTKTSKRQPTIEEDSADNSFDDTNLSKTKSKRNKKIIHLADKESNLSGSLEIDEVKNQKTTESNLNLLKTNIMAFSARTDNFSPWMRHKYDDTISKNNENNSKSLAAELDHDYNNNSFQKRPKLKISVISLAEDLKSPSTSMKRKRRTAGTKRKKRSKDNSDTIEKLIDKKLQEKGLTPQTPETMVYVGKLPNTDFNVFLSPDSSSRKSKSKINVLDEKKSDRKGSIKTKKNSKGSDPLAESKHSRTVDLFFNDEPRNSQNKRDSTKSGDRKESKKSINYDPHRSRSETKTLIPKKSQKLIESGAKAIIIFVNKKTELHRNPFDGNAIYVDDDDSKLKKSRKGKKRRVSSFTSTVDEEFQRPSVEDGVIERSPSGLKTVTRYPCGCIKIIKTDPETGAVSEEISSAFCREGSKCEIRQGQKDKRLITRYPPFEAQGPGGDKAPQFDIVVEGILSDKPIPPRPSAPQMKGTDLTGTISIKTNKFNGVCNFYIDPRFKQLLCKNIACLLNCNDSLQTRRYSR